MSLYAKELACQQKIPTPGYYSSLNGAEICRRAAQRPLSRARPSPARCDGPNRCTPGAAQDDYPGHRPTSTTASRASCTSSAASSRRWTTRFLAGPFVAKADATTGKQIWRTYLDNPNASGRWIANANLNILDNGNIAFAWANQIVLIDGDTGEILKHNTLPARRRARSPT